MRITGGRAKGRVLRGAVPDGVRPTSARVREALFSMIGQDLDDLTVLDAFGGSGCLGLEAWSRGASVTAVERRPRVARLLRRAGASIGADAGAGWRVEVGDVLARAPDLGPFDGVLADPPYADAPEPVLGALGPTARRWLVYEARRGVALPPRWTVPGGVLRLRRERAFGDTVLWIYDREDG